MKRLQIASTGLFFVFVLVFPAIAQQDRNSACRQYADTAMKQIEQRRSLTKTPPSNDPRWKPDWKAHYDWCMLFARPEQCAQENKARQDWLNTQRKAGVKALPPEAQPKAKQTPPLDLEQSKRNAQAAGNQARLKTFHLTTFKNKVQSQMKQFNAKLIRLKHQIDRNAKAAFESRFVATRQKDNPNLTKDQILNSLRTYHKKSGGDKSQSGTVGTVMPGQVSPSPPPPVISRVDSTSKTAFPGSQSTPYAPFRKMDHLVIFGKHFGLQHESSITLRPEGSASDAAPSLAAVERKMAVDMGALQWALLPVEAYWYESPTRPGEFSVSVQFYMKRPVIAPERWVLEITTKSGKASQPLMLMPHVTPRMISGYDYLEKCKDNDRTHNEYWSDQLPDHQGSCLRAFHDPRCKGVLPEGDEGTDWFFRTKKLPQGVQLVRWMVDHVNPESPDGQWNVAWNNFTGLCNSAVKQNYWGLLTGIGELVAWSIAPLIDEKTGKYGIEHVKIPQPYDPSLGVKWYTTCYSFSPMDNVTLTYVACFFVLWPDDLPFQEKGPEYMTRQERKAEYLSNPAYW